jgi:hypothetical protein
MTGNKYVSATAGGDLAEVAANQVSAGAGDAGKLVALNASGQVDSTMLPGSGTITMTASEAIAAGALVNIFDVSGTGKVRNADNTSSAKKAHGFAPSAISSGATGPINIGSGVNSSVSALTDGAEYFLGTTGGVTTTAPTASGSLVQKVGVARSATELEYSQNSQTILRA